MKRLAIFAVVVLGLLSISSHAQDSGIELQTECQSVGLSSPTPLDSQKGAHCLGYIAGVAVTLKWWEQSKTSKHLSVEDVPACLPDHATTSEYRQVILKYLADHPNELHHHYAVLIVLALADAYPCGKASQ
jgi:hypothetical protein